MYICIYNKHYEKIPMKTEYMRMHIHMYTIPLCFILMLKYSKCHFVHNSVRMYVCVIENVINTFNIVYSKI